MRGLKKRLDKARAESQPCGASRHVHMIVDALTDKNGPMRELLDREGYEPEHMADSIGSVLEGLWNARRWLKWEHLPPTKRYAYNGHWVPDLDAIAKWEAEQGNDTAARVKEPIQCH